MADTTTCKHCDADVAPSRNIVREPSTGRNKEQWICLECGGYLGGSGRFV